MEQINFQVKYPPTASTERGRPSRIDANAKHLVYCISNVVVVRSIENLSQYSVFDQHKYDTTAVSISPSGNLCCSGDVKGNIMVWELNIVPHPVFKQYDDVLGGAIKDICWTGDGERLALVGEGKTYFGKAILLESGSSVGELSGVALTLNACAIRLNRPFRLVLGGDESAVYWYEGPPFKYKKSIKQHNNSIFAIKFNNAGDHFVSVGADKKIFLYDGKTGDLIKEITADQPHTRSITGLSWIDDHTFITSSNDTTLKIWNFDGLIKTLKLPNQHEIDDMQVGVAVNNNVAYSISLTGALNIWKNLSDIVDGPTERLYGHNAPVGQILVYGEHLITGDNNGRILIWQNGVAIRPEGVHHTKQIISLSQSNNYLYSLGGEQIKRTNLDTNKIEQTVDCQGLVLKIQANQQKSNVCYVLFENKTILQYTDLELTREYKLSFDTSSFLVAEDAFLVGDLQGKIHKINIESGEDLQQFQLQQTKITALALQGDKFLCGDTTGKMKLIDYKQNLVLFGDRWTHHTTIISSLSFSQSGKFAISTGFDNKIMIWNLETGQRVLEKVDAHKRGVLTAVITKENKVVSSGGDNSFKEWVFNID